MPSIRARNATAERRRLSADDDRLEAAPNAIARVGDLGGRGAADEKRQNRESLEQPLEERQLNLEAVLSCMGGVVDVYLRQVE